MYNGIGNIVSVKTYDYTPKGTEPSGTPVTKSFTYNTSRPDRLMRYNGAIVTYNSMGCPTTFNGMSATWTRGKLAQLSKGTGVGALVSLIPGVGVFIAPFVSAGVTWFIDWTNEKWRWLDDVKQWFNDL